MLTFSAVDAFVGAFDATVGAQEAPPASNAGMYVELAQKTTGGKKGDAWCADQVAKVAVAMFGKRWPLRLTGSVQELYLDAVAKQCFVEGPVERGDLVAIWHADLGRYAHVLVVAQPNDGVIVDSISGNTTDPVRHVEGATSREGWCVSRKPWHLAPLDKVIRWRLLLPEV